MKFVRRMAMEKEKAKVDAARLLPVYLFVQNQPISLLDPLGAAIGDGQIHGNYCGNDWSDGGAHDEHDVDWGWYEGLVDPMDDLDMCCLLHDACCAGFYWPDGYTSVGPFYEDDTGTHTSTCDDDMCACVDSASTKNWKITCWCKLGAPGGCQ